MIMSRVAGYTVPGLFHQIFGRAIRPDLRMARFPEPRRGALGDAMPARFAPASRLSATPV